MNQIVYKTMITKKEKTNDEKRIESFLQLHFPKHYDTLHQFLQSLNITNNDFKIADIKVVSDNKNHITYGTFLDTDDIPKFQIPNFPFSLRYNVTIDNEQIEELSLTVIYIHIKHNEYKVLLEIDYFYIHPTDQNNGLGSKILNLLKSLYNPDLIEISLPHISALPFYFKHGFKVKLPIQYETIFFNHLSENNLIDETIELNDSFYIDLIKTKNLYVFNERIFNLKYFDILNRIENLFWLKEY